MSTPPAPRFLRAALVAAALLSAAPLASAVTEPVKTDTGLLSGLPTATGAVRAYLGIPYAAPPVGDLRWRPPQPAPAWSGVRRADKFALASMQPIRPPDPLMRPPDPPASEDSLYLNVWTPAKSATEKLAVLFWIHGGGNVSGTASMPHYNGEHLAAKGVVVVSINYRLGVFGWMAHPELTAESPHRASGNYALLDAIAALQWVQRNIAAFGGDPARVTIWGQSAGGSNASALIASPLAKGLFARAILVSGGGLGGGPDNDLASAEQGGVAYAKRLGAASIAELRALPAEKLRNERLGGRGGAGGGGGAVVDGWVLPDSIGKIVAQGKHNRVPVIAGSMAADMPGAQSDLARYLEQSKRMYGDRAGDFLKIYPAATEAEAKAAQLAAAGDRAMASNRSRFQAEVTAGNRDVYLFYFTQVPPVPAQPGVMNGTSEAVSSLGAYHGAELVYTFGTLKTRDWPWTPVDLALAERMMTYWTNFAKAGTPNAPGTPEWPAWTPAGRQQMVFGDTSVAGPAPANPGVDFFLQAPARGPRPTP